MGKIRTIVQLHILVFKLFPYFIAEESRRRNNVYSKGI